MTLTRVFFCEFCEISKNTYFIEHLRTTNSGENSLEATTLSLWTKKSKSYLYKKQIKRYLKVSLKEEKTAESFWEFCKSFLTNKGFIESNKKRRSHKLVNKYMFKVSKRYARKRCEKYSKLTIKTPERSLNYVVLVALL